MRDASLPTEPSLFEQKGAALKELARWRSDYESALASLPNPPPFTAIEAKLLEILPLMPDPGWRAPTMRMFSIGGAIYIAVYLTLQPMDAAQVWALCEAATKTHFANMKGFERMAAANGMFSWPMRFLTRSLEARSKEAPVGGWQVQYLPGEGADFGVDYGRCAIHQLALDAGAAAFAPFICNSDAVGSAEFGWGLQRTETIAQGGKRCDFRFKRGGETKVRLHLAPSSVPPKSEG